DPVPIAADLPRLYEHYYTHRPVTTPAAEGLSSLYNEALQAVASRRLGYPAVATRPLSMLLSYVLGAHPGRRGEALMRLLFLPRSVGTRVLEVGFGDGRTLRRLSRLGWEAVGVEFDPVAIEQARASGIKALPGALEDQDLPVQSVDAVLAGHVIEHLADPLAMLVAAKRVLTVGGTLILVTPNAVSPGHAWFNGDWRGLEPPRHLNIFTRASLAALVERAGFSVVSNQGTGRSQGILRPSFDLRRHRRRSRPMNGAISLKNRLLFEALEVMQAGWAAVDHDRCEEIVLVARSTDRAM
ncbi:MAG: class I SAM-dependent methyltransferase, partial [Acidobacteriota bacterium]